MTVLHFRSWAKHQSIHYFQVSSCTKLGPLDSVAESRARPVLFLAYIFTAYNLVHNASRLVASLVSAPTDRFLLIHRKVLGDIKQLTIGLNWRSRTPPPPPPPPHHRNHENSFNTFFHVFEKIRRQSRFM